MKKLVILIMVIICTVTVTSRAFAVGEAYKHLRNGRFALDEKSYLSAAHEFEVFLTKNVVLKDYALLWLAKAHYGAKMYKEAIADIQKIKKSYSKSPIYKDALRLELDVTSEVSVAKALALSEGYLNRYPKDTEVRFDYAKLLDKAGKESEASNQFAKIYIMADRYSKEAAKRINVESLSLSGAYMRARNLMKKYYFDEAEEELRKLQKRATPEFKKKIMEDLAICFFRQKKYTDSAEYFHLTDSPYYEARSLYRAGKYDEFNEKVDSFDPDEHPKAAELVIIKGLYYRRRGDTERALEIFKSLGNSRFVKEDAQWHVGWTYYLSGEFSKAYDVFSSLSRQYDDNRYLFWMAKANEKMGNDSTELYEKLTDTADIYTYMAMYRMGKEPPLLKIPDVEIGSDNEELKRLAILLDLGIDDALRLESMHILKNAGKLAPDVAIQAGLMMYEARMYRYAIVLASQIPYSTKNHKFFYPVVYKDVVNDAANKFSINPMMILSIIREESRFQDDAYSQAGAIGLMQLMPSTASKYSGKVGVRVSGREDIMDVKKNILLGSCYLSKLISDMGCVPVAVASYNAGEWVVEKWVKDGNYSDIEEFMEDIPYDETRKYVKKVLKSYFQYSRVSNPQGKNLDFVFNCQLK